MKKYPTPLLLDVLRVSVLVLAVVCSAGAGRKISVPHDFPSIHAALGECDAGDTIFVAKGFIRENIALADNIVSAGRRHAADRDRWWPEGPLRRRSRRGGNQELYHAKRDGRHPVPQHPPDNRP